MLGVPDPLDLDITSTVGRVAGLTVVIAMALSFVAVVIGVLIHS